MAESYINHGGNLSHSSSGRQALHLAARRRACFPGNCIACLPVDLGKHMVCSEQHMARAFFQYLSIQEPRNQIAILIKGICPHSFDTAMEPSLVTVQN